MNFHSIIGHNKLIENIKRVIALGSVAHAHIIVGPDGIGKSYIAKEIAKEIIGLEEYRQHVDIVEWRIQKNKQSIGVDEIRRIIEEANKKPYECDKKAIVIYTADKMTVQAQNAFLKTIEEPAKGVYIILLVENLEVILDTIKSRCQIHKLNPLTKDQIKEFIKRHYPHIEQDMEEAAIALSEGIPGRIDKFINDVEFKEIREIIKDLMLKLEEYNLEEMMKLLEVFVKYKKNYMEILNSFLSLIRDVIIYKETSSKDFIINKDSTEEIVKIASLYSIKKLNGIIDLINTCRENIDRNVNYDLAIQAMLLKLREV